RTAATFRRPTKAFQDGLAANPANIYLLTLDDVIASEGGIPIVADGKIIGAIGCSGGTSPQDGQACQAGGNALKQGTGGRDAAPMRCVTAPDLRANDCPHHGSAASRARVAGGRR